VTYDLSKGDWKYAVGAEAATQAADALTSFGEAMASTGSHLAELGRLGQQVKTALARWETLRRQGKLKGRSGWKSIKPQ
jgi:hypothetical protein